MQRLSVDEERSDELKVGMASTKSQALLALLTTVPWLQLLHLARKTVCITFCTLGRHLTGSNISRHGHAYLEFLEDLTFADRKHGNRIHSHHGQAARDTWTVTWENNGLPHQLWEAHSIDSTWELSGRLSSRKIISTLGNSSSSLFPPTPSSSSENEVRAAELGRSRNHTF